MEGSGNAFRTARNARGWSQQHLAEAAGVSERTVKRAERGESISGESMMAISAALDLDAVPASPVPRRRSSELLAMALKGEVSDARRENLRLLADHAAEHIPDARVMVAPDVEDWVDAYGHRGHARLLWDIRVWIKWMGMPLAAICGLLFAMAIFADAYTNNTAAIKSAALVTLALILPSLAAIGVLLCWERRRSENWRDEHERRTAMGIAYVMTERSLHRLQLGKDTIADQRYDLVAGFDFDIEPVRGARRGTSLYKIETEAGYISLPCIYDTDELTEFLCTASVPGLKVYPVRRSPPAAQAA